MAIQLKMPALSPTMEVGTVAKWLVKEGDEVSSGDILAEIETDKATMEFEAVDEGVITKILVEAGTDEVAVGTVIAEMAGEDEEADDGEKSSASAEEKSAEAEESEKSAEPKDAEDAKPEIMAEAPPPPVLRADDPSVPEGTSMASLSVREALRDAMAEEMRKDDTVFVMGE